MQRGARTRHEKRDPGLVFWMSYRCGLLVPQETGGWPGHHLAVPAGHELLEFYCDLWAENLKSWDLLPTLC